MRKKPLLLGIALLAMAYGYYTTLARVSGSEEHATAVAIAEMGSAAPAVLFGWLADKKGTKVAASLAPLSGALSLLGTDPLIVFTTLSLFYSAFIMALLAANEAGAEELGTSVGALSLGWAVGVALVPYAKTLILVSVTFFVGSLLVLVSIPNEKGTMGFLAALPKLKPLILPLALFMGAEYVAYALTAWRFYNVTNSFMFVLSYAVGPGVTSFVGGLVAGKALERLGPEKVLIASVFAYPFVVALALLAPPPLCLLSWSIPVYPFYEASLVALVTKIVPEAKGASLGFTYSVMAISSLLALPLTKVRGLRAIAYLTIILMVVSGVTLKKAISRVSRALRQVSPRP